MTLPNYSKEQLIDALVAEYEWLCHDDHDPDVDPPLEELVEEYRETISAYSIEELIEETSTDQIYSLDEFMRNWGDK
jgi:hypothetical protein